jgi:hypothetical protein
MIRNTTTKIVSLLLPCIVAVGCGSPTEADYIPSEEVGKQALETALAAWQSGAPMALIENAGSKKIQPQDSDWKSGKKLASYSITQELPTTEGPKQFAVRLTLKGVPRPVETKYYVLGGDPLWVFRDGDYQRTSGSSGM